MSKTGLVLEGGAMRGLFSAGVMDVLMENNIRFDTICGVSAGAAFGCNYKSHQIGRAIRYNLRFCKDKRYCSWHSWLKTGDLFGADFCYHRLPTELDLFDCKTFETDPTDFYLVCTDVETGKAHYQLCNKVDNECFEWMRASASMPLVSNIVTIGGRKYLDGAIADSIPLKFSEQNNCSKNVVILTQCRGYEKKPLKFLPLIKLLLGKYPALIETMSKRHTVYNSTLEYVEKAAGENRVFIFRPDEPLPCSRICHDPALLRQTYDIGRKQSLKKLNALREFLNG